MRRPLLLLGIAIVGAAAIAAAAYVQTQLPSLEVASIKHSVAGDTELCPWRDPAGDMAAFFPGTDKYSTDILVLSRLRRQILARLGPDGKIDSNALYVYRVASSGRARGSILVSRTAGEYGAIETVVGLGPRARVVGVRIQRHREPPATGRFLTSAAWLNAFRGKTALSPLKPGVDLPSVPPSAHRSAASMCAAVRALLIEVEVADTMGAGHVHEDDH